MEEIIKKELLNYNMYRYELSDVKIKLNDTKNELADMTAPVIGGSSYEINSDIRSKNKTSESVAVQAIRNIDIEEQYKSKIVRYEKRIKELELIIDRTEKMLDLVDNEDSRIILKRRYFDSAKIDAIMYESNYSRQQVTYKISKGIEDIARKLSYLNGIKNNVR